MGSPESGSSSPGAADWAGSGEVVGRLYAISTAGSLCGTMLAALPLVLWQAVRRRERALHEFIGETARR